MISDKKAVQDLVILMWEKGIRHVVISPGSRNAPLTLSFNSYESFNCYSIVDERSAGFVALGMAQELNQPVAVICTSGTASLNYGPAIAEAFYQKIPLLVITADRPKEVIDQGEGQSIRQEFVFKNHTLASVNLLLDQGLESQERFNQDQINLALTTLTHDVHGPVHINIPLEENLYGTVPLPKSFPKVLESQLKSFTLNDNQLTSIKKVLENKSKILLLCGQLHPNTELEILINKLAGLGQFLVLTETTSNLNGEKIISSIDRLIMTFDKADQAEFRPDLIISIGDNIISKKIKFLLRELNVSEHWQIGVGSPRDTFRCLSQHYESDPIDFFAQVGDIQNSNSNYSSKWIERDKINQANSQEYLDKLDHCDFKVFESILPKIASDAIFQMGNSSVVRYVQLFNNRSNLIYRSNRGTSGIDGCTSTAAGVSMVSNSQVILVTGDLSFFYDNNALWNKYLRSNLKIVLVNNGGGGIFRIIEGPSGTNQLEDFFETRHELNASHLAAMHKFSYFDCHTLEEIDSQWYDFIEDRSPSILEIFTKAEDNDGILKAYFKFLSENKVASKSSVQ